MNDLDLVEEIKYIIGDVVKVVSTPMSLPIEERHLFLNKVGVVTKINTEWSNSQDTEVTFEGKVMRSIWSHRLAKVPPEEVAGILLIHNLKRI